MKPETRERVIRVLLAALMNSELSARQLSELADEMSSSSMFLLEFGALLKETTGRLRESGPKKAMPKPNESVGDQASAYSIVQRQRLSKSEVLDIIASVSPSMRNQRPGGTKSVREILENFFDSASIDEVQRFMNMLRAKDSGDPYLRGIIKKG